MADNPFADLIPAGNTTTSNPFSDLVPSKQKSNTDLESLKYLTGSNRTPLDPIRDLAQGVLTGLGKGGQFVGKQMEKIPGFHDLQQAVQQHTGINVPEVNMDETFSPIGSPNKSLGGEVMKGIGEYAPYGLVGGASLFGQVGAGIAHGAATTAPEETNGFGLLPNGSLGGAIKGGLLNAAIPGLFKGLERLRPSKMFRGNLTAGELQKNLDVTKGSETGLGDVIGSPFLKKRLENTLPIIPFSGANESLQRTGKVVEQKGNSILQDLLGDHSPDHAPATIAEELGKQFESNEIKKTETYKHFNKLADESNLKLDLPRFSELAKKYSNAINASDMLKFDPDAQSLLKKLENYQNPVSETGTLDTNALPTLKYSTAKEALLLKGKLNTMSNAAKVSPDAAQRGLSKVFGNLASALRSDIGTSVSQTKNAPLIAALHSAEENYAKNFSPFLDRDIYKYVKGGKDPETIVTNFLKTSNNTDLANHLTKLTTNISPQSRDLLAYSYLSRALDNEGNLNPAKLSTAIKKLGKNQLKELVPDPIMRRRLLNYTKFEGMNKEAQYLMFNPKTGQRNSDALVAGMMALLGHTFAGDIGALAAAGVPIAGGRLMTKALTSEKLRESLVKAMIKNKTMLDKPRNILGIESLSNSNQGDQNAQ